MEHLVGTYKLWYECRQHLPKVAKYTLGEKVDALFLETIELLFSAQYAKREEKLSLIERASVKFDTLKFFVTILWETKNLHTKHYTLLSEKLHSIGKMLGGWLNKLKA